MLGEFDALLRGPAPLLALAPMQDVTDLPFWKLIAAYGGADVYFTEYFRVHATSRLEPPILASIVHNPTGRPVIAQMIGNDVPALIRTALELQQWPIVAVDLNLGCPAPIVYRKCAGGGLLREPRRVDAILGALREAVKIKFTVKTRLGFDSPAVFLANGNVYSAKKADDVLRITGARGLMIGRGAIRNPWLFHQIRQLQRWEAIFVPTGHDVLNYLRALYEIVRPPGVGEKSQVQKMKKYLNYVGLGIEPTGQFLHQIRRVTTEADFFRVCEGFLNHDQPMPLEPFALALKEGDVLAGEHS